MTQQPLIEQPLNETVGDLSSDELREIAKAIEDSTKVVKQDDSDTFFKNVVKYLMDTQGDTSAITEYLNVQENFAGAKLEYLGKYGNMPFCKQFLDGFERKRISLERKGRKELVMALQERMKQEQQDESRRLMGQLGL